MDAIFKILDEPVMNAYGFDRDNMYGSNATDTPEQKKFIVVSVGDTVKSFTTKGYEFYTIWVHQQRYEGITYTDIKKTLQRITELLVDAEPTTGEDDRVFTGASWNSNSPDLVDDGYGTITKNATFRVASHYAYVG